MKITREVLIELGFDRIHPGEDRWRGPRKVVLTKSGHDSYGWSGGYDTIKTISDLLYIYYELGRNSLKEELRELIGIYSDDGK